MSKKDELLAQAKTLYCRGETGYRDTRLELGRVLHEYVLECLCEGERFDEVDRHLRGITRAKIIKGLAGELRCLSKELREIIQTAMTVQLFGGDLGAFSWMKLRFFNCFVERIRGTRTSCIGRDGPAVSSLEEWRLKPAFAEKAKALFRLTVERNSTHEEIRTAVLELFSGPGARPNCRRHRRTKRQEAALDVLKAGMKHASPGDVAETCLQLIAASEDPWAVAQHLLAQAERFKKKKEKLFA